MKISKQKLLKQSGFMVLILAVLFGCKKDDKSQIEPEIPAGQVLVQVNMMAPVFESESTISARSLSSTSTTQVQQIKVNQDINLTAELVPDSNTTAGPMKRAVSTAPLATGTRYRLMVYLKGKGDPQLGGYPYITERDYIYGQEDQAAPLLLDGEKEYIFVAYSVNSKTEIPPYSFADSGNGPRRELYYTTLRGVDGRSDLLFFKKELKVSGNGTNYLDLVFRHVFSQVTLTLDSQLLGMNFQKITGAKFSQSPSSTGFGFINESFSNLGASRDVPLTFRTIAFNEDIRSINSDPVIFMPRTNGQTLPAKPKLTLGLIQLAAGFNTGYGLVTTNIEIGEFDIQPGVKYNLKISLTSNDKFGTYLGQSVVRIGGRVWKRFNEGAIINPRPDDIRPTIIGNQWTFGYKDYMGITNALNPINGFEQYLKIITSAIAWNGVVDMNVPAIKTATDPCPNGFRVPTTTEYNILSRITNMNRVGNWEENITGIISGLEFTSKTVPGVKITFPAGGVRNNITGILEGANSRAYYRTSTANPTIIGRSDIFVIDTNSPYYRFSSALSNSYGGSIRCIAETSDFIKL